MRLNCSVIKCCTFSVVKYSVFVTEVRLVFKRVFSQVGDAENIFRIYLYKQNLLPIQNIHFTHLQQYDENHIEFTLEE